MLTDFCVRIRLGQICHILEMPPLSWVDVIVPCMTDTRTFCGSAYKASLRSPGLVFRVLIIDDASPDDTAAVAAESGLRGDHRVHFRRHSSNMGHIATYNQGIAWASADYMVLLSADDYLLPDAISRAAELMDRHPSVGFTFGRAIPLIMTREQGGQSPQVRSFAVVSCRGSISSSSVAR